MRKHLYTAICVATLVTGCGDNGISEDTTGRMGSDNTRITLKVTDAPIDNISEVWLQFTAVELKPVDADALHFDLDTPQNINLLALMGAKSEILLDSVILPAGDYDWIRLYVNASIDGIQDSYVRLLNGSEPELNVPSGSTTGILLNRGFTADASVPLHMTIDFDLRRSITITGSGDYQLSPVLTLIDDSIAGTISGTIDAGLLSGINCSDADTTTGNALYLFSGNNIIPDDIDNMLPEPYTTAMIDYNDDTGLYEYEIGFVPEGKYTLAFTCASDADELSRSDDIVFTVLSKNVNITSTSEHTIPFR